MIVIKTNKTIVEVLDIGKSIWTFFAKISCNNPEISEWITLENNNQITFPVTRMDDFVLMCAKQEITIEWR